MTRYVSNPDGALFGISDEEGAAMDALQLPPQLNAYMDHLSEIKAYVAQQQPLSISPATSSSPTLVLALIVAALLLL